MILKIEDLSFSFKDKKIFNQINLSVNGPGIIGLVAPNGTGKSTFINLLNGTLSGFSGAITYKGVPISSRDYKKKFQKEILRMPDQFDFFGELSGRDHLKLYYRLAETPRSVEEVIERLQMGSYSDQKVSSYSLGMRQRLAFAMSLVANPQVFLLDEIMNSLDPMNVQLISEVLLELVGEGKIIFLVSHILHNLEALSERIIFLRDQKIVFEYLPRELPSDYLVFRFAPEVDDEVRKNFLTKHLPNYIEHDSSFSIKQELTEDELRAVLRTFVNHLHLFGTIQLGPKSCHVFYRELYL